jgi:hypothetical protein
MAVFAVLALNALDLVVSSDLPARLPVLAI